MEPRPRSRRYVRSLRGGPAVVRIVGFKLNVKEIHGYRPDLGLWCSNQAALDRRTAARRSATDSSE
jgi:hypothetical protein